MRLKYNKFPVKGVFKNREIILHAVITLHDFSKGYDKHNFSITMPKLPGYLFEFAGDCKGEGVKSSMYKNTIGFIRETDIDELFIPHTDSLRFDFGKAIEHLKSGKLVRRAGWNGKGIFIELQTPDEHSKMTHPYIFIDTTGLKTDNPDAPKDRVPWLASQTDMLAEDWELVK